MVDGDLQYDRSYKLLKLLWLANKSIGNSKYTSRQFAKGYNHIQSYWVSSSLICSELSTKNIIMLSKPYSFSFTPKALFLLNLILTVIRVLLCLSLWNNSVIKRILYGWHQETHFSMHCKTGRNVIPSFITPKCKASEPFILCFSCYNVKCMYLLD